MKDYNRLIGWLEKKGYVFEECNSCVSGFKIVYVQSFAAEIYEYLERFQKNASAKATASFTWLSITVDLGTCQQ